MRIRLRYLAMALFILTAIAAGMALTHMNNLPAFIVIAPGYLVQAWLFETHRALGRFGYQVTMVGVSALVWTLIIQVSPGHVEIGIFRQSFHRSVRYESGVQQTTGWDRIALLVRMALGKAVALEIDGLAWHRGATDSLPTRDYFDFTFGAGVSA